MIARDGEGFRQGALGAHGMDDSIDDDQIGRKGRMNAWHEGCEETSTQEYADHSHIEKRSMAPRRKCDKKNSCPRSLAVRSSTGCGADARFCAAACRGTYCQAPRA